MAVRQNIGVGGLYPTGRSPMVLDFKDTSRAISERMIKREQERIGQEKDYMEESHKAILEALSFEAVQGASDTMQLRHLDNVNKVADKWADVYAVSDGKLSVNQLAELQKDKRKIDTDLMNMKTNVKEFELVQKEILSDPQARKWDWRSHEKFGQMAKEGRVGDPETNWLDVLIPRQRDLSEILNEEGKAYKDSALANIDVMGIQRNEDGSVTWNESNKRILDENFDALFNSRIGQGVFASYGGTEDAKNRFKDEYKAVLNREIRKPPLDYANYQKAMLDDKEKDNYYVNKYGKGWSNLKPEHVVSAEYLNNIAEGALQLDPNVLKLLSRQSLTNVGIPGSVSVHKLEDGNDYIVWVGQQKDNPIVKKLLIPDRDDEEAVAQFKAELLQDYKTIAGKDKPPGIGWIVPNWEEYKGSGAPPVRMRQLDVMGDLLKTGSNEPIKPKADSQGRIPESSEYNKDYIDVIFSRIKTLVPDAELSKGKTWVGGESSKTLIVKTKDENGKPVSKEYYLNKKESRQELADWIEKSVDYEATMRKRLAPRIAGAEEEEEDIVTQEDMDMLREASRQEQIKNAKKLNVATVEEFISVTAKIQNKSPEEVRRLVESLGLTDADISE